MLCGVFAEETLGHLQELRLELVPIEVESKHYVDAFGDKLSMLHLVFCTVELNELKHTVHQLLSHRLIHLTFNGL